MKCIITHVETDNKWDNMPLCKEIIQDAKTLMRDQPGRFLSMKHALATLQKAWHEEMMKEETDQNTVKVTQDNSDDI